MPKDNQKTKIKEWREGGFGGWPRSFRVIEVDEVPEGAEVVAADTPVCDWTEVEN